MVRKSFNVPRPSVEEGENEDECVTYGKYVGQKLKRYSTQTKCAVQHAISEVIFKADKGMYEFNNYPSTGVTGFDPVNRSYASNTRLSPDITYNSSPSPSTCNPSPVE